MSGVCCACPVCNETDTPERIKVLPWARGYHAVQSQANTALFVMARTAQRDSLFKWVGPIAHNRVALISRKDRGIVVDNDRLKTTEGTQISEYDRILSRYLEP